MSNLTFFVIAIITLFLALLLLMFLNYWFQGISIGKNKNIRREINRAIIKDELRELESEKNNDKISLEDYEINQAEIQRRALEEITDEEISDNQKDDKKLLSSLITFAIVAVVIIISSSILYLGLGTPAGLEKKAVSAVAEASHQKEMEKLLETLEEKLIDKPDNAEGWRLLASSYKSLGNTAKANSAYKKLRELIPEEFNNSAQLLADYADSLATENRSFVGEPTTLLELALKSDPQNIMALWLRASAYLFEEDFENSLQYWLKLRPLLPPDSQERAIIQAAIDATAEKGGMPAIPDDRVYIGASENPQKEKTPNEVSAKPLITGVIDIEAELLDKINPQANLIIVVRAIGERIPVATQIIKVPKFPYQFSLSDLDVMRAEHLLSSEKEVNIAARISIAPAGSPSDDDLISAEKNIKIGENGIKINISKTKK